MGDGTRVMKVSATEICDGLDGRYEYVDMWSLLSELSFERERFLIISLKKLSEALLLRRSWEDMSLRVEVKDSARNDWESLPLPL